MNESIPIALVILVPSLVFGVCALVVMFAQAKRIATAGDAAKKLTLSAGLSLAISLFAALAISFFAGPYVIAILIVILFIVTGKAGLAGVGILGLILGIIIVVILIAAIGIILSIWPITVMSSRAFRIMKHTQEVKWSDAFLALTGSVCCVLSMLSAAVCASLIAIQIFNINMKLT